jgi:hypothetical protein
LALAGSPRPASGQEATTLPASAVNQIRPTTPDSADFVRRGHLQLEAGYRAAIFEGDVPTLHSTDLIASVGVGDLIEARLGWNVFSAAGDEAGIGDLAAGVKGGFFGGLDDNIALAALGWLTFPSGDDQFGLGSGVGLFGGLVATTRINGLRIDVQAALDTHLFGDDTRVDLPLSGAVSYSPIEPFAVVGDVVESIDLTNLSDSSTSVRAGVTYRVFRRLSFDTSVQVGLSQDLPDVEIGAGLTTLLGPWF